MADAVEATERDAMPQLRVGTREQFPKATIHLCGGPVPFYSQEYAWSCSYACAMMFVAALAQRNGGLRYALADDAGLVDVSADGVICATGIRAIQQAVERAWNGGLNARGREKILALAPGEQFVGRAGPSALTGPCQIKAALREVDVPTTTEPFEGPDAGAKLLKALLHHFTTSADPAPCIYTNNSHVRVVVGVVVVATDDVRPVYLDPKWAEVEAKVLLKSHLRGRAYELLYLE